MGALPEFFVLIKAAKYLNVPIWDLVTRMERGEQIWFNWAQASMRIENEANAIKDRIARALEATRRGVR